MALFKIFKGKSTDLASKLPKAQEGFCYFTPDTGRFYIDTKTEDKATIGTNRIPLTAGNPVFGIASENDLETGSNLVMAIGADIVNGKIQTFPGIIDTAYIPGATLTKSGVVTTVAQGFFGDKTFNTGITITSGAQIKSIGKASSYVKARENAMITLTEGDVNYRPFVSLKTQTGDWSIAKYNEDGLFFVYISDVDYNTNNNTPSAQIIFQKNGTIKTMGSFWSTNATDSTSITTGSGIFAGGVGIAKKLYVGTGINIDNGDIILQNGSLAIKRTTSIAANNPAQIVFHITQTDNNVTTSAGSVRVYDDEDAYNYGLNMVIESAGNMIIGGGESPSQFYSTVIKGGPQRSGESLYLTSDYDIYFYTNCQTIGSKAGVTLNSTRQFYPDVNNTGSIGTSNYKWGNIYSTTFHGALDGNATTATRLSTTLGGRNYIKKPNLCGTEVVSNNCKYTYDEESGTFTLTATSDSNGAFPQVYFTDAVVNINELIGKTCVFSYEECSYSNKNTMPRLFLVGTTEVNGTTQTVSNIIELTPGYNKYKIINFPAGTKGAYLLLRIDQNTNQKTGDTLIVKGVSLQLGETETGWIPAPENNSIYLYERRTATTSLNKPAGYGGLGRMFHMISSSSTTGNKPPVDSNILQMNWDNDGGWDAQLAIGQGTYGQRAFFRGMIGSGSWPTAWREVVTITTSTQTGSNVQPVYINNVGQVTACTYALNATVASGLINKVAFYSTGNQISYANTVDIINNQSLTNSGVTALHNGLFLTGQTYGNDAPNMISKTAGVFTYGDGGPQIKFSTTTSASQNGALIFTDHDAAGAGVSWHFVSDQGDWNVNSKRFVAKSTVTIGENLPNNSYNLYVNGTACILRETTAAANTPARLDFQVKRTDSGSFISTGFIAVYDDGDAGAYGTNMVIQSGGNMVIGSGESPYGFYNAALTKNTGETLYLTSDGGIYFYTNCDTIGNRAGVVLNTARQFYPDVNNTGSIGISSNRWNSIYATTVSVSGGIVLDTISKTWIQISHGDGSALRNTQTPPSSGGAAVWSVKTQNGAWGCAGLGANDNLWFSYGSDSNYQANNNVTKQISFTSDGIINADLNGQAWYVRDSANGSNITMSYSSSGLSSANWFAAWNGYQLRAISPANLRESCDLDTWIKAKRAVIYMGTGAPTAGWRRVCTFTGNENYTNCLMFIGGGWNNGEPSNAIVSIHAQHTTAVLSLVSCGRVGNISQLRLINASGGVWYLDAYVNTAANTMSDQRIWFLGNINLTNIVTTSPSPVINDNTTPAATCVLTASTESVLTIGTQTIKGAKTFANTVSVGASSSQININPSYIAYQTSTRNTAGIQFYAGDVNGNGIRIGDGGLVVIGAGESSASIISNLNLPATTESLYLTADSNIYFYTNCDSIGSKIGVILNNTRVFYPDTDNTGAVGGIAYRWANMYAVNFNGNLKGNADTATSTTLFSARDGRDNTIGGPKPNGISWSSGALYFSSINNLTTSAAGGGYIDLLVLNTWRDSSGGKTNALAFLKNSKDIYYYQAAQSDTTWGSPSVLLHSDNYTNYTVKKDGTGASGTWSISISGNAKYVKDPDGSNITVQYSESINSTSWFAAWDGYTVRAISASNAWSALGGGSVGKLNTNSSTTQFLRGDGTWATPPTGSNNVVYSNYPISIDYVAVWDGSTVYRSSKANFISWLGISSSSSSWNGGTVTNSTTFNSSVTCASSFQFNSSSDSWYGYLTMSTVNDGSDLLLSSQGCDGRGIKIESSKGLLLKASHMVSLRGKILYFNGSQSGYTQSDRRLKTNIKKIINSDIIDKLEPVSFEYNTDNSDHKEHFGLIAQDVAQAFESCGYYANKIGCIDTMLKNSAKQDNVEYYSLNYQEIFTHMLKRVQDQTKQIKELQEKLEKFEKLLGAAD